MILQGRLEANSGKGLRRAADFEARAGRGIFGEHFVLVLPRNQACCN